MASSGAGDVQPQPDQARNKNKEAPDWAGDAVCDAQAPQRWRFQLPHLREDGFVDIVVLQGRVGQLEKWVNLVLNFMT
jgi:hypothetical protein